MRMAGAVALGVIILEALLVGAFLLGFYWLGEVQWGILFAGILLLLIALPWLGELVVRFDSRGPKGEAEIGWWGRAAFAMSGETTHLVVRVLGIPIRRTMRSEKPAAESSDVPSEGEPLPASAQVEPAPVVQPTEVKEDPQRKPKRKKAGFIRHINSETIEGLCRMIGSGLGATCELVWGAREIEVRVYDPMQKELVDALIAEAFGYRGVGPVNVLLGLGDGRRRVQVRYRIGLLRMVLAGLQVLVNGRPQALAKQMKETAGEPPVKDRDEELIEQIRSGAGQATDAPRAQ